jgi:hypothetical protein
VEVEAVPLTLVMLSTMLIETFFLCDSGKKPSKLDQKH